MIQTSIMIKDLKLLSSSEGRIEDLLVTLPPAPSSITQAYYGQIEQTFGERSKVIRFQNYLPPRNPNLERIQDVSFRDRELQVLRSLNKIGKPNDKGIYTYHSQPSFYEDFLGNLARQLQKGIQLVSSEWTQDPFVVLQHPSGDAAFLQPLYAGRCVDRFISLQLAAWEELPMAVLPTPLHLEGGNVLAGPDFALIGKDTLVQNVLHAQARNHKGASLNDLRRSIVESFRTTLGIQNLIWVGFDNFQMSWRKIGRGTFQPLFHLDLFLTLGGQGLDGRQVLFMGDPSYTCDLLAGKPYGQQHQPHKKVMQQLEAIRKMIQDLPPTQLPNGLPFKIVPIPMAIFKDTVYSYNNGLVESFDQERIAYLPDYVTQDQWDRYEQLNPLFRHLQSQTEECLLENGFTQVVWIGPGRFYRKLASLRGSLHCITKVLRRSM